MVLVWAVLIVFTISVFILWLELGRLRREVAQLELDVMKRDADKSMNRPLTFEEARKEKDNG